MKKLAILQSNYIPWKGYFDMIAAVDEFIIYDDMQYTKNDWRNRNQIKTPQGVQWLTVPVGSNINRKIKEVELDPRWQIKHWNNLESNYGRSKCFGEISSFIKPLYLDREFSTLSELNRTFIETICRYLSIKTTIRNSWDYALTEGKTERLVDLCNQAGATKYISGPSARNYIDVELFHNAGIALEWFDYSGYKEYPQLWGNFTHGVTILDLLFNCGVDAHRYMRHVDA